MDCAKPTAGMPSANKETLMPDPAPTDASGEPIRPGRYVRPPNGHVDYALLRTVVSAGGELWSFADDGIGGRLLSAEAGTDSWLRVEA